MLLYLTLVVFCRRLNCDRPDRLIFSWAITPNLQFKLAVVQHVITSSPQGSIHSFRWFVRDDFYLDIYLSGKRVTFTSHVIERYTQRITGQVAQSVCDLIHVLISSSALVMRANRVGSAIGVVHDSNVLCAFTFVETDTEIRFTTCLSTDEISHLEILQPIRHLFFHYGSEFKPGPLVQLAVKTKPDQVLETYRNRVMKLPEYEYVVRGATWHAWARHIDQVVAAGGRDGAVMKFLGDVHGPAIHMFIVSED